MSGESVADTRQPFFRARGKKPDSPFRPTPEIKRSTRQQIDLFVSVHTNLYFITTETFIGKTLFFCTNSALRHMPYNGFEKYFIRETESRLASGYQSTEKMPRRSFPKAPSARKRADHLGSSGRTHSSGNCRRLSLRSHLI